MDRLDVYSRHLFRLPRERVAMLLLMAAASRVRHQLQRPPRTRSEGHGQEVAPGLLTSLHYISSAESIVLELGLPASLLYRVLFQRIKTMRRVLEDMHRPAPAMRALVLSDMGTLGRLADTHPFWSELVRQQRRALERQVGSIPSLPKVCPRRAKNTALAAEQVMAMMQRDLPKFADAGKLKEKKEKKRLAAAPKETRRARVGPHSRGDRHTQGRDAQDAVDTLQVLRAPRPLPRCRYAPTEMPFPEDPDAR